MSGNVPSTKCWLAMRTRRTLLPIGTLGKVSSRASGSTSRLEGQTGFVYSVGVWCVWRKAAKKRRTELGRYWPRCAKFKGWVIFPCSLSLGHWFPSHLINSFQLLVPYLLRNSQYLILIICHPLSTRRILLTTSLIYAQVTIRTYFLYQLRTRGE